MSARYHAPQSQLPSAWGSNHIGHGAKSQRAIAILITSYRLSLYTPILSYPSTQAPFLLFLPSFTPCVRVPLLMTGRKMVLSIPSRPTSGKLFFVLSTTGIFFLFFRHRVFIALCLMYTYFAFMFLRTSIIEQGEGGGGDGIDLMNMKPVSPGMIRHQPAAGTPRPIAAEIVPRVLHQVRLGGLPMRPEWEMARQSCIDLHDQHRNWTIQMWEDDTADKFVLENYPHLFDMYRGYPQGELSRRLYMFI